MRGNTNPCNVCEYCDDSCDVCLHQPYEHTIAGRYREAYSDDEWAGGDPEDYASTDVDSASDEEGSWFTTPWSQLITQRVAGYEVDPNIGVQLDPLPEAQADEEEEDEREQQAKEGRHRRRAEKEQRAAALAAEGEEDPARGRRQRRLRRRRTRRDSPAAAAAVVSDTAVAKDAATPAAAEVAEPAANGEALPGDPEPTACAANDEAWDLFSDGPAQPANAQAPNEGDALPKDTHNNMWRATVHSSHVSLVGVS